MAKKTKTSKVDTLDPLRRSPSEASKSNVKPERIRKIDTYHEAVGRRKTAVARVRIWSHDNKQEITVNNKDIAIYFPGKELQDVFTEPLSKSETKFYKISAKVFGGGLRAQAFAARHGLSRALILLYPESKTMLKALGFLTRDPRMKERKKPGLKGARRAPQWSKR